MLRSRPRPEKERQRRRWFRWKCIGSSSTILYMLLVDDTLTHWRIRAELLCVRKFVRKLVGDLKATVGYGESYTQLYATIGLEKARVGRTRMIPNEPVNPRWYETFRIYCAHMAEDVIFTIEVDSGVGASLTGRAYLRVTEILGGEEADRWLEICDEDRKPVGGAKIHVKVQYFVASKDRNWARGVRRANYPYTYFSQRQGCKVTIYQDAHVPDNFIPQIHLADGRNYEPRRCWEDIFDAISNALHLIYIPGWSVYTLGELLKMKANEGV